VPTWHAAVRAAAECLRLRRRQWTRNGVGLVCSRGGIHPPVSKHDDKFWRFLTSGDIDLWPFQLKIGAPLTRDLGTCVPILIFYVFFLFFSYNPVRVIRTDRRADGRASRVMRPIRQPHNNSFSKNLLRILGLQIENAAKILWWWLTLRGGALQCRLGGPDLQTTGARGGLLADKRCCAARTGTAPRWAVAVCFCCWPLGRRSSSGWLPIWCTAALASSCFLHHIRIK